MNFLSVGSALALLSILAIFIPIIIHYLSKRKTTILPFPYVSLMKTKKEIKATQFHLQQPLLLLLRILLLILVGVLLANVFWKNAVDKNKYTHLLLVSSDWLNTATIRQKEALIEQMNTEGSTALLLKPDSQSRSQHRMIDNINSAHINSISFAHSPLDKNVINNWTPSEHILETTNTWHAIVESMRRLGFSYGKANTPASGISGDTNSSYEPINTSTNSSRISVFTTNRLNQYWGAIEPSNVSGVNTIDWHIIDIKNRSEVPITPPEIEYTVNITVILNNLDESLVSQWQTVFSIIQEHVFFNSRVDEKSPQQSIKFNIEYTTIDMLSAPALLALTQNSAKLSEEQNISPSGWLIDSRFQSAPISAETQYHTDLFKVEKAKDIYQPNFALSLANVLLADHVQRDWFNSATITEDQIKSGLIINNRLAFEQRDESAGHISGSSAEQATSIQKWLALLTLFIFVIERLYSERTSASSLSKDAE